MDTAKLKEDHMTAVTIGRRKEIARPRNEVVWLS